MFINQVKLLFVFFLTLSSAADTLAASSSYVSSAFRAEGYREQSQTPGQKMTIKASLAEGLNQLNFKTLYGASIEIETVASVIKLKGDQALVKADEIIVKGRASFRLSEHKNKQLIFVISSLKPEDVIRFDTESQNLTAPAAILTLNAKTYRGRGLTIALSSRQITWVQSVSLSGVAPAQGSPKSQILETPLTLRW